MKKLLYLIFLITATIIVMHSCKKDKIIDKQNNENVESYEGNNIYKNLINFRDQIKNPLKTSTSISCDSAMWYMEALMNACNSNPDSIHPKNKIDTAYFSIQLDSMGNVPMDLVSETYYEMKDTIFQRLAELESESKHFWGADLQMQSNQNSLDFMVVFAFGYNWPWAYDPFTEDDDWIYGLTLGYCITGAPPYSDGNEELEWRLNHPYFAIGGVGTIIEIVHFWKNGLEYPEVIYYEFVEGDFDPPCMENEELTDRLWLAHDVFYKTEFNGGWLPDNTWTFEYCDFKSYYQEATIGSITGYEYWHGYNYWLAKREDFIIHD